jgi:Asp-tRNA(Asn)/Glu-tRNA(Gln) amidotransferase A subunit family amidase
MGWLFRDLMDAPLLAVPFAPAKIADARPFARFAYLDDGFLKDCEPEVADGFHGVVDELRALGLEGNAIDPEWWEPAVEIFAPLQASEAARLHAGSFEQFEITIRDRLKWGAGLSAGEVAKLRQRHAEFRARMDELFAENELIVLPCAPVARLEAGADHSQTRSRLLRYTAPFSLAGAPAIAVPCIKGGVQIAAARERDEALLELAARIGKKRQTDTAG